MDDLLKRFAELSPAKRALLSLTLQSDADPEAFPLSFAQERLWFLDQLFPNNPAYHVPLGIRLEGRIDLGALARTMRAMVRRHEILRTHFAAQEGRPVQLVADDAPPLWQVIDLQSARSERRQAALGPLMVAAARQPFDLARGPLLRCQLFRLGPAEQVLLITLHHIIFDGWSINLFLREIAQLYVEFSGGRPAALAPLGLQYADFAVWQREWAQTDEIDQQLNYWRRQLADPPPALDLPLDYPRPAFQTFNGATQRFMIPAETGEALKRLGRQESATLFMTALAAWQALLYRYTGQADLLIGAPVANRRQPETEALIGFFVNTLALRGDLSGKPSFRELTRRARAVSLAAYDHQDLPFERLIDALQVERTLSGSPLFQVMFSVQSFPRFVWRMQDLTFAPFEVEPDAAKFELSLTVEEDPQGLAASLQYNTDLFAAGTIARMGDHLRTLMGSLAAAPDRGIAAALLMTDAEQAQLLTIWSGVAPGARPHSAEAECVHRLFEAQAVRTPDAAAVLFNDERTQDGSRALPLVVHLTYGALNRRANQLAHALRRVGVRPETLVSICMERTPEIAVGLLGILKAGGAFVPLDPEHPPERRAFMLEDSRARVIVTNDGRSGQMIPAGGSAPLVIDLVADAAAMARESAENLRGGAGPANLAYVIYTSGSTGIPKGVLIEHGAIANTLSASQAQFQLSADSTLPCIVSFAFDIALFELFGPLLAGGRAIILTKEQALDLPRFAATLEQLSFIHALPSLMRQIVDFVLAEAARGFGRRYRRVQQLFVGGDLIPPDLVIDMRAAFPGARIYLGYGPTESAIMLTNWVVPPGPPPLRHLVGGPMRNMAFALCDAQGQIPPLGAPGEILIGGFGVARGYLNRPDLTAERFTPNPFSKGSGVRGQGSDSDPRLYRTGDLARGRADGNLEFLRRADQQVKIRGFRIELGEIEALLRSHPAVRAGVVVARADAPGDARLVAYIVPAERTNDERRTTNDGSEPSSFVLRPSSLSAELRDWLRARLPDYMIPSAFVFIDALPLTTNGKVDRKALPDPPRASGGDERTGPRTPLEQQIAAIWREALQIDHVGLHDNFFELGGHSLLMVRVHSLLRAALGRDLAIVELFQYPTVHALAERLSPAEEILVGAPPCAPATPPTARTSDAIAIIGMAGRFPGAPTLDRFWQNLREGVESIRFFTSEELIAAGVDPALAGRPDYVPAKGALDEVERFDAAFFGLTPREAEWMDPQHRIFLECAWEALERAGYDSERYAGRIGVFAGVSPNTYLLNNLYAPELLDAGGLQSLIGSQGDSLTTRLSYKLNLRGLSVNVQTACSTSLVAVALGCESLLNGQCDMVLAGGAAIRIPAHSGYLYEEGGIGSPDGRCRPFDAAAQGTVGGDGAGVVLLKRLDAALCDGDPIQAVIKGWALNNDGAQKVGYTAPGVEGQRLVIAEALAKAGVDPATLGYVEAHGTGTPLGDPIEVAALTQAFRTHTDRSGFCALGSVKANIGHLDAAAGVAGLIKAVLALQAGELPPSAYFERPNPQIDFAGTPFYVNSKRMTWPDGESPRRAGVSSFGIGGTNAHVVLEQAPARTPPGESRAWQLIPLSARTPAALDALAARLADELRRRPESDLADIAYTLQAGRRPFEHRRALVVRDRDDALALLEAPHAARSWSGRCDQARPVVFLFPGQGSQFEGMGRELYEAEPVFRAALDRCAELFRPRLGLDVRALLYPAEGSGIRDQGSGSERGTDWQVRPPIPDPRPLALDQTQYAQPALFAVEYALAQLWMSWGMRPAALIGHSLGEYVAATIADVFSLEDATAIVAARGRLMQRMPDGAMLAAPLSEADLRPLLDPALSIAAVNAPELCVVSGPVAALDAFQARLAGRGVEGWRLATTRAFHSAMVEPILAEFATQVGRAELRPPRIPFVSNVSGTWIAPDEATDPGYWVRHARHPVQFARGLQTALADGEAILLEVGPGRALSRFAQAQTDPAQADRCFTSLHSSPEPASDQAFILAALGRMWLAGASVDWGGFSAHERRARLALPTYPFERKRYWIEPQRRAAPRAAPASKRANPADWIYRPVWRQSPPLAPARPEDLERAEWLIFADAGALSRRMADRLARAGHAVTTVCAGDSFAQIDERSYQIDPDRPEDYAALLGSLAARGRSPQTIVHLWTLTSRRDRPSGAFFERCQRLGYYSLLYLARALGQAQPARPTRIEVVTNESQAVTGGERARPEKAMLLGPCKVIPQEYLQIACRCVDVVVPSERRRIDGLIDQLLAEFRDGTPEPAIAYRGRQRWAQAFEPARASADRPPSRLRDGGVYLITGGLGVVGMQVAEYLARTYRARLALIGRSPFPAREEWVAWLAAHGEADPLSQRIQRLLACEAHGSEALVIQADVTQLGQLQAALAQVQARFGALHGVLHAAAARRGPETIGPIAQIGRAESEALFQAKTHGTAVLSQALRGRPLDFCLLFSSNAAILGGLGFAAYAAANLFVDAFAAQQHRMGEDGWLSVNWDGWPDDAAETDPYTMPRDGATAALEWALALPMEGRAVVATGDLNARLATWIRREGIEPRQEAGSAPETLHPRPEIGEYIAPRDETERRMAEIWRALLGLDRVGAEDHFFALGGHSLLALQLIAQIRAAFAADLPLSALFADPTVAGMARAVAARPPDSPRTPGPGRMIARRSQSIDQQLDDLAALAPGEAARLLQSETQRTKREPQ